MAHFAKLDENYIVTDVIVVNNNDMLDNNGNESEEVGIAFIKSILGEGVWVQTSYNGNFRKNYAGIGFSYDPVRDAFIPPKPGDQYIWDEDSCQWIYPTQTTSE